VEERGGGVTRRRAFGLVGEVSRAGSFSSCALPQVSFRDLTWHGLLWFGGRGERRVTVTHMRGERRVTWGKVSFGVRCTVRSTLL
jgi:hypothetical protein